MRKASRVKCNRRDRRPPLCLSVARCSFQADVERRLAEAERTAAAATVGKAEMEPQMAELAQQTVAKKAQIAQETAEKTQIELQGAAWAPAGAGLSIGATPATPAPAVAGSSSFDAPAPAQAGGAGFAVGAAPATPTAAAGGSGGVSAPAPASQPAAAPAPLGAAPQPAVQVAALREAAAALVPGLKTVMERTMPLLSTRDLMHCTVASKGLMALAGAPAGPLQRRFRGLMPQLGYRPGDWAKLRIRADGAAGTADDHVAVVVRKIVAKAGDRCACH